MYIDRVIISILEKLIRLILMLCQYKDRGNDSMNSAPKFERMEIDKSRRHNYQIRMNKKNKQIREAIPTNKLKCKAQYLL